VTDFFSCIKRTINNFYCTLIVVLMHISLVVQVGIIGLSSVAQWAKPLVIGHATVPAGLTSWRL